MKRVDAYDRALRRERIAAAAFPYFLRTESCSDHQTELKRAARLAIKAADVLLAELRRAEKEGQP